LKKFVNPKLKTAVQGELRTEYFVLAENQKESADAYAQQGQGSTVAILCQLGHRAALCHTSKSAMAWKTKSSHKRISGGRSFSSDI